MVYMVTIYGKVNFVLHDNDHRQNYRVIGTKYQNIKIMPWIKCSIILVYYYIISFEKWILYSISVPERFIIVKNKTNVLKDKHTV